MLCEAAFLNPTAFASLSELSLSGLQGPHGPHDAAFAAPSSHAAIAAPHPLMLQLLRHPLMIPARTLKPVHLRAASTQTRHC